MRGDTCPRCKRFIQEGWDHQCPPKPTAPYAEQAEQAREDYETRKAYNECCNDPVAETVPTSKTEDELELALGRLADCLDTLARVESVAPRLAEIISEVTGAHSEPQDANYNNCETPDVECQWCFEAKQSIGELLKALEGGE